MRIETTITIICYLAGLSGYIKTWMKKHNPPPSVPSDWMVKLESRNPSEQTSRDLHDWVHPGRLTPHLKIITVWKKCALQEINISPWFCLAYLSRWCSELPQVGYGFVPWRVSSKPLAGFHMNSQCMVSCFFSVHRKKTLSKGSCL